MKIKLNAIIIDDSPESTETLVKVLEKYFAKDVFVSNTYTNAQDAIDEINLSNPEIIFLDLEMPDIDGFETYKLIPQDLNPSVIIYSGRSEEGVRVLNNLEVEGFVTKPIVLNDLRNSIKRVKNKIIAKHNPLKINEDSDIIILNSQTRTIFVGSDDIERIEALGSYTNVYYNNTFVNTTRNLKYYETFLNPNQFVRVDRSFLINVDYIREIIKSNYYSELILKDNFRLKISNNKMNDLIKRIGKNSS